MATLSTHVLDTGIGRPAAGVTVTVRDEGGATLAEAETDADGRVGSLGGELAAGRYRLTFETGDYFSSRGETAFHPRVVVEFTVDDPTHDPGPGESVRPHYHVPLLLSRFGYTTYRGS